MGEVNKNLTFIGLLQTVTIQLHFPHADAELLYKSLCGEGMCLWSVIMDKQKNMAD